MCILHVFDLDGTLLRDTTASLELARHLDLSEELHALEQSFLENHMTTGEFALRTFSMWKTLTRESVKRIFHSSPWIEGVREVFDDIAGRGEHSLVITMSPDFFANHLMEFGVKEVFASRFPSAPFAEKLDLSGVLTPEDKVTISESVLKRHNLSKTSCIAYGDSSSDIPLFQHLEKTVSINATNSLKRFSKISYEGNDLMEAYQLARSSYLPV